jgi:hypothetical protein
MEMQQTHYYTTGTATLPWKCNMVHRSCYQGKPNMSQYYCDTEDSAVRSDMFDYVIQISLNFMGLLVKYEYCIYVV